MSDDVSDVSAEEHWDARYTERERIWSGRPNHALVREVADLPPGTALDLGCGEGADAVWLAQRGWRVTAVDISQVALDRAAAHASDAGVDDRIDWQRHDLALSYPAGTFDLVSAQFLHSFVEMPRERILRDAAPAVAPGGVLLIVSHSGFAPGEENPHPEVHFPTPDEVLEALELPDGEWEVLVKGEHEDVHTGRDGQQDPRVNNTLKLRRSSE